MFAKHEAVNHGIGEYVRDQVHTNTVEGYFSLTAGSSVGTYHHVGQVRLPVRRARGAWSQ
jgi:hypothetical protein